MFKCFCFCCTYSVISIILTSRKLMYYSVSPGLLLITSNIFITLVIVFFSSDWFFFVFSSSLLKFSLCSCILSPRSVSILFENALNTLVVVIQSLSHVQLFATPWTAACQDSMSFTISQSFLRCMSIKSVIVSNHLILCHPLPLLPSIFSNESALRIRWPKYWSFSFCISPSNEYSGLISFRTDWFDLLAVQRTLKSLLQHHNLKASILWCSAFFYGSTLTSVHDYQKTIALTIQTFVGKVMSFLFNMLSRFVITFLPRSKRLLISWLQSHPQWS